MRPHRAVVSFVRRSTRMNESQARAWDRLAPRLLVDVPRGELDISVAADAAPLDREAIFGRCAPLMVEIGCGTGDSLVAMAGDRPEADVLAFDVFSPALASTMIKIERAGLTNVRLIEADAAQGVPRLLGPGALSETWTFFPDPWPKSRHHKRRLVSPEFADLLADRTAPGGLWRLATDWPEYADWMLQVLQAHPRWQNLHPGWAPRTDRPVTRFERRGIEAGRPIRDLVFRRVTP